MRGKGYGIMKAAKHDVLARVFRGQSKKMAIKDKIAITEMVPYRIIWVKLDQTDCARAISFGLTDTVFVFMGAPLCLRCFYDCWVGQFKSYFNSEKHFMKNKRGGDSAIALNWPVSLYNVRLR